MDLWDTLGILRKRWYVVLPMLAVTGLLVMTTSGRIAADYRASASVLLVAPGTPQVADLQQSTSTTAPGEEADPGASENQGANQFIDFPGTLKTMAEATALSVGSQASIAEIRAAGGRADLDVAVNPNSAIIVVTATDGDPDVALETMDLGLEDISDDLAVRQSGAGVPVAGWITAQVLDRPEVAVADATSRLRVRVALLAVGLSLTVVVAVLLEGFLEHRRASRTRRDDTKSSPSIPLLDELLDPPDDGPPAAADSRSART